MTIDKVHELVLFLLVSEKQGKHTPKEIDNCLHLGQTDYFNSLKPQFGVQFAVMGQGTAIHEALNPFRVVKAFTNADTAAGVLKLADSEHTMGFMTQITDGSNNVLYGPVAMVNDDELAHRLGSQIVGPTERNPVAHFSNNKEIQFYPKTPKAGKAFYLKGPVAPVYAYTEVGRELKYSAGRSTQLLWNDIHIPQVIMRALQYLGVNLEADTIFQAAQLKQAETR
jgi:hypothetical protein